MSATSFPASGALARARSAARRLATWSLPVRLASLVAAVAVPLILVNVLQARQRVQEAEEQVLQRLEARALLMQRTLDRYAAQMASAVDLMEGLAFADGTIPARADERLRALQVAMPPEVSRLVLASPGGRILAASRPIRAGGDSIAATEWFQEALASRALVVSEPYFSRQVHRPVVAFARSVRNAEGEVVGIMAATLNLDALSTLIDVGGAPEGSLATILSRRGRVITRSAERERLIGQDLSGSERVRTLVSTWHGRGLVVTRDGIERLSAWSGSPRLPWVVYVGSPVESARAVPLRAALTDLLALLAATLAGVVVAIRVGRRVTQPMRALQDAARDVARGDYSVRLRDAGGGPFGGLQDDFNTMVARIGEADARREASEARLRSLLSVSSDWMWEQDEALGLTYGELTAAELAAIQPLQARRVPFRDFELRRMGPTGETRWIAVSGEPVFAPDGRFTGYRGVGRDVDRRRRAEEAMRRSESHYRALVESTGAIVWTADVQARLVEPQPAFAAFTGLTFDEYRGHGWLQAIHPEDRARFLADVEAGARDGHAFRIPHRLWSAAHGQWRQTLAHGVPQRDAGGAIVEWVGSCTDVHEHSLAESARRSADERLEAATHAAGIGVFEYDLRARSVFLSPAWKALLGYADEEVANDAMAARALTHPEDVGRIDAELARCLSGAEQLDVEYRARHRDGTWRWMRARARTLCDGDGRASRCLGACVDITGIRVREAQIASQRRAYEMALSAGGLVAWAWQEGEPALWGKGVESIRGPLPAGAATYEETSRCVHPDDHARYLETLRRTVETSGPYVNEFRLVWADGSVHWIKAQGAWERDAEGHPLRLVGISQNITEKVLASERLRESQAQYEALRRKAEAELQEANALLERRVADRTAELQDVNKELEAFSYTVAHDLRAPLRAIEGFSQMLEDDLDATLAPEPRRLMQRIRVNTRTMAQMIDELLEFSRIGRAALATRPVDLGQLARETCDELHVGYPNAALTLGELPVVAGDPTLLRVVLANLVGNALKFSGKRAQPRVSIEARDTGSDWDIAVSDNGVGFDPQYAERLFGVFQRLHSRDDFEGTGIGLATVARIVARHGGVASATSEPGKGATFRFTIPHP